MFKNETKTRMMAMAVVAMFMLTAFSIAFANEGSDAAITDVGGDGSQANPFTVNLRTTDTFSYTPTANLSPVTFSAKYSTDSGSHWTDMPTNSSTLMNFDNGVLSGGYTTAGTYDVEIKAHWQNVVENPTLAQDAYQYIRFTVIENFSVADISNVVFLQSDKTAAGTVASITTTNTPTAGISWSVSAVEKNTETSTNIFAIQNASTSTSSASNAVVLASSYTSLVIPDDPGYKIYTVTVTAVGQTAGINASAQTVTKTFDVTISKVVTAAATVSINTFVGAADTAYANTNVGTATFSSPFTVSTNTEVSDTGAHVTPSVSNGNAIYTVGIAQNSDYGFVENAVNNVYTNTATYTVNGTVTGIQQAQDVDVTVSYNVYAKLGFVTTPTANATKTFASSADSLEVLASCNLGYANKVIFSWGDGQVTENNVYGESALAAASHRYAQGGMYRITVTAINDFGSASSVTLYNAGNDATLNPAPTHEITIRDGADTSRVLGSIEVEEGKNFRISAIVIDEEAQEFMEGKKIVALYTEAATIDGENVTFDATKQWKESNIVYSSSPEILYADVQDTTATDDFFAEHGWIFIVFIILTILAIVLYFYFGFQHPAVPVMVVVFAVFAILCFVYKDFNGIWNAIQALFGTS